MMQYYDKNGLAIQPIYSPNPCITKCMSYGLDGGRKFEIDLVRAINHRSGRKPDCVDETFLFTEEMLKKKFGCCLNDKGQNIIGVDILCFVNSTVYAIQCKQYASAVPKQSVIDFIMYVQFLEQHLRMQIRKVWSSSMFSTGPGNELGNTHGFKWIVYPTTTSLVINTVSWLFTGREIVEDDGDCKMD